jgi:putative ABC transport system permease protein
MYLFRLIAKNLFRHKLRSALTVLGIAIAVTAFSLLRTVVSAWNVGVEASAADRLITRHSVSFIFPLPLAYRTRIASVDGVELVTFANWFGGVYIDKKQFFARLAVDADNFFDAYPEFLIPKDQLDAFKRDRSGCVIGQQLAERYNLTIGDVMPIEGDIYPGQWQFTVRAIYTPRDKITDPSNMLFQWQYLEERLRQDWPGRAGYVGWYVVKITHPQEAAAVSERIDANFANSPAETKTETERAFSQGFLASVSAVFTAINILSFVIIGIILLVLGNTMIMSARERTREYAVMKTLGFSRSHLMILIGGESLMIALLGGLVGIALSFPMVQGFEAAMPKGWFPIFTLETLTLTLAVAAAIFVGIMASIFPIHRAIGTKIVDGLRQVG